jgi:hypothetical protein
MREQRTEPRTGILARIEALWEDETGTPRIAPAKLEDKSRRGMSIRVNEPIRVGTKLTIQWLAGQFSGTVTYCCSHGKTFVLGIKRDPTDVD